MRTLLTPAELEARLHSDGHTELASLVKQLRTHQPDGVVRVNLDELTLQSDPWSRGYAAGVEAGRLEAA